MQKLRQEIADISARVAHSEGMCQRLRDELAQEGLGALEDVQARLTALREERRGLEEKYRGLLADYKEKYGGEA